MRNRFAFGVVVGAAVASTVLSAFLVVGIGVAFAVSHTVNFTVAQDTFAQTRLIPAINRAQCAQYGLGASCTSAQLVSAGCTTVTDSFTNLVTRSCTIFTQDAAGEDAFIQEVLNRALVDIVAILKGQMVSDTCAKWQASNGTVQTNTCNALGQAVNNCSVCQ